MFMKGVDFMSKLKISLYENAIDSINHGVSHLKNAVEKKKLSDYKQAILSIFQATELLLKELLAIENPIYMFDKNSLFDKCQKPLEPTLQELYNCKSLEVNKLCKEVVRFYPEVFNKTNIKIVERMAKERNKIQHFAWEANKEEIKKIILELWHNIISPSLKIIEESIECGEIANNLHEDLEKAFNLNEIANNEEHILSIEQKSFTRMYCYKCGEYSLFAIFNEQGTYPEKAYCTSCDFLKNNINVEEYMECPDCGFYSMLYDSELGGCICLNNECDNNKSGGILVDEEDVVFNE